MQTKKKVFVRGSTRELANPRILRSQKKLTENGQAEEKKVSELITSSVRKPKPAGSISKKHQENVAAINLDASYNLGENDGHNNCLEQGNTHGASVECMGYKGESQCHPMGTIFSPAFHLPKSMGEEISEGVHFLKFFGNGGQTPYQDDKMEYSRVNIFNYHIARRSFDCTSQKDEHSSEVTQISANMGSQSDLEVHTDPPFTASDTRNCVNEVLTAADTNTCCDTGLGSDLSSEVSSIYLAMKSSTQECVGEYDQDSMKTDECIEEDDEELDDFDPYFFIKNLPGLSSVVPTFRPMLLPKQTRSCPSTTLVLDLDETLVHSSLEPCTDIDFTFTVNFNLMEHTIYVRCRPYLKDFMEKVSSLFEIIIFTASQSIYAEQLLNMLDPNRKIFRHRVYRDSCVMVDGNYLKDLSILGRDLARVIIIDNSPQAFGFQVDNGIPIESWFDDRSDQELLLLLPFLESLVGVKDVRPLIAEKFNLRQKIAAAACP